jgi:ABC-type uncharacterized transport system ATPase subunit
MSTPAPVSDPPAVRVRGLSKAYGAVRACDAIDIDFERGQIHGVLGENGAGKSTLMRMLIGLVQPDAGTIEVHGERVRIDDPARAAALGIGMVHQHFSLVDELRVWENVALGEVGRLDAGAARRLVRVVGERYGLDVDPDARVGEMTVGLRQRVEIIKCLRRDPQIVIFDEPTSVLTPQESQQLFEVLRHVVAAESKAVALVSHKLDEIERATDVVTILRGGRVTESGPTSSFDARALAQAMVGRPVSLRSEGAALGIDEQSILESGTVEAQQARAEADVVPDRRTVVLEISKASRRDDDGRVLLDDVDLRVHAGEIVGVAGVEGNGQVALSDVLASLVALDAGSVSVGGHRVETGRPGATVRAGLAMIPEDRHDAGCVLDLSVAENLALDELGSGRGLRRLDKASLRAKAAQLIAEFEVSCVGPDAPFRSLSGGNQQRVVLARELASEPVAIVACQPTRGLDVGATEFIGHRLRAAAASGVGVLLISSELDEILHLADRIVVLHAGRIVGEMQRTDADLERLGMLMGGSVDPLQAAAGGS